MGPTTAPLTSLPAGSAAVDPVPYRLRPGVRVLRRDLVTWQVGLDPARAVLVRGADPATMTTLARLADAGDAASAARELARLPDGLRAALAAHGLLVAVPGPPGRARQVRVRARTHGDVAASQLAGTPDPVPRRFRARVAVDGAGPVAAQVAVALAHAGVRTVALVGPRRPVVPTDITPTGPGPADVGRPWPDAVAAAVRAHGARTTLIEGRTPHLVLLTQSTDTDVPWTDPALAEAWVRAEVPHLTAAVAGLLGTVSPLVLPGRTACLWCEELARADAEPSRPVLAEQLRRLGPAPATVAPGPVVAITAALTTARMLARLDVGDDPDATRLTVQAPGRVSASPPLVGHPACGCGWVPGLQGRTQVTMER